jgi:predicted short-subunit dehydrogenase-like oxidoreductase (DUF2520 family)
LDKLRHHIIGTGRWGSWLARRLVETGFELASVRNRTAASAQRLAKELKVVWSPNEFGSGQSFTDDDVVWCCVQDDELAHLSKSIALSSPGAHIVHCSGTSPLLEGNSTGVFWPIQSFTSEIEPDWDKLPITVQASSPAFAKTLLAIAEKVSGLSPKLVKEDVDRMQLHLGAVMTQNFSNLLWRLTEEVLAKAENDLDYKLLLPLAQNHLSKLSSRSPTELQTGPASRGDEQTLSAHLALLEEHSEAQKIYSSLSALITKKEV